MSEISPVKHTTAGEMPDTRPQYEASRRIQAASSAFATQFRRNPVWMGALFGTLTAAGAGFFLWKRQQQQKDSIRPVESTGPYSDY